MKSKIPIIGRRPMLRVQQRAMQEMMKAMMRMMSPMIIRAATAWAHAVNKHHNTLVKPPSQEQLMGES